MTIDISKRISNYKHNKSEKKISIRYLVFKLGLDMITDLTNGVQVITKT